MCIIILDIVILFYDILKNYLGVTYMKYQTDHIRYLSITELCEYKEYLQVYEHLNKLSIVLTNLNNKIDLPTTPAIHLIDGTLPCHLVFEGHTSIYDSCTLNIKQDDRDIISCCSTFYPNRKYIGTLQPITDAIDVFKLTSTIINKTETDPTIRAELDPLIHLPMEFKRLVCLQFSSFFNIEVYEDTDMAIETIWSKLNKLFNIKLQNIDTYNSEKPMCVVSPKTNVFPIFIGTTSSDMQRYISQYPMYTELVTDVESNKWWNIITSPMSTLTISNIYHYVFRKLYSDCKQYTISASLSSADVQTLNNSDITTW